MEAFGLAVNVYVAFKEVYLVARFMHRTSASAKNYVEDRRKLRSEFAYEVLFLQSLGKIYLSSDGEFNIMGSKELDALRATQVANILEQMRMASLDYARLAQVEDGEYKAYSPILNNDKSTTTKLEFDINMPLVQESSSHCYLSGRVLKWTSIIKSPRLNETVDAWHWALRGKKKFETVLHEFQRQNRKLKDILPLWTAAQIKLSQRPASLKLADEDNENTGCSKIASGPRQPTSEHSAKETICVLRNHVLDAPSDTHSITMGKVTSGPGPLEENVLVEYKEYKGLVPTSPSGASKRVHSRAEQFARFLASSEDRDLSTLPFKGIINQEQQDRYAFIFDYPINAACGQTPLSLYSMIYLNDSDNRLDLFQRFKVAQILARSIEAFHNYGWVHKSIRSESITFFYCRGKDKLIVDSPYLSNFELSRPETPATVVLDSDNDPTRNLYQHPDRHPDQKQPPQIIFSKKHDVYALGIVLLEIGLWQTAASIFKQYSSDMDGPSRSNPKSIQTTFVNAAREQLAHRMGQSYMEAVMACIDDSFDGQTSKDDFSMIFHEKVVTKLTIHGL